MNQQVKASHAVALVLMALLTVLAVLGLARGQGPPSAAARQSRALARSLVDRAAANVAAARHRYEPRRWDRVYALAWQLHRYRQLREMQRTDGARAWQPLDLDTEGQELDALVQLARSLARTARERELTKILKAQAREAQQPALEE